MDDRGIITIEPGKRGAGIHVVMALSRFTVCTIERTVW